jgi:phenylalanyl-tRNA synthetase beta chain
MAARAHRGPEAARLGSFAALHPHLADDLGFDGYQVVVSLLDMSAIYEASKSAKPSFRSPSRLPGIKVDVALALPASLSYAEVEIEVRRAGGKLLDSLELFDLFEGGTLEPGQRSLAFRAVLRAPDRTLVEKDEQKFIKKVTQAAERLGGSLRG